MSDGGTNQKLDVPACTVLRFTQGVADYKEFTDAPELFMFGMLCTLGATAIWLILATAFEMPVSTTHSVIGGVLGFAISARGRDAVVWYKKGESDEFPVKGVSGIFISWIFSPVASGILAAAFFWSARTFVLRSRNAFDRTFVSLPVWIFVAVTLNVLFVTLKGASSYTDDMESWLAVVIAFACGIGAALIAYVPIQMYLKPRVVAQTQERMERGEIVQVCGGARAAGHICGTAELDRGAW